MAAPDRYGLAYNGDIATILQLVGPGRRPYQVVAGAGDLPFLPRFIHVSGAAGSVTYVAGGVTVTETLEIGCYAIRPDKITAIAGGTTVTAWD